VLVKAGAHRQVRAHVDEMVGQIGAAVVCIGDKRFSVSSPSRLNDVVITGVCNGQAFTAQLERGTPRNPLALVVQHNGTRIEAMVVSPRMAELHALMPFKAPPDMSKYVLSPMPGLLVQVAVQPGQKVQAGERVAVIEAMKMENVLFASADGVVGKVLARQGESQAVDQPIVEFECAPPQSASRPLHPLTRQAGRTRLRCGLHSFTERRIWQMDAVRVSVVWRLHWPGCETLAVWGRSPRRQRRWRRPLRARWPVWARSCCWRWAPVPGPS